uniref:Uncharacterized protein n=1 Tax=Eutreptiella gymnastica TaxID=73025 RepID=A0A7S4GNX3_9EUGL
MGVQQRVPLMRQAKLLRIPIFDSDIEQQLVGHTCSRRSSSSSSNNDSASTNSPCDCDLDDNDEQYKYMSIGSTVGDGRSDSSLSSNGSSAPQTLALKNIAMCLYIVTARAQWMLMPCP